MYDTALWSSFSVGAINRLASCYTKCMKCFFGYSKYSSVTGMLLELGLPSFSTMWHNSKMSLTSRLLTCENVLVQHVVLHSLICRVLLLLLLQLLLLLRNASDLRNCTSYFGACMWVWYCRPPIGAHFPPPPTPPFPSNWGRKRIYVLLWQQF